ncbi:AAA domain containing protein [uncultured Caudovirales phage]|uniref:AAA domain containing protein n=1 Tax=uncultured Caudovirales phage TaxID=2100421 RepID=A0A6J7WR17_9CAUD|nr:AAA domain containing protein [uncultured Caudovirales phage]CAB5219215.1 AAA domain containing protein [uncultured Caudovirales phage]
MFATIMKSMTSMGIRSVAVVPITGAEPRVFSRLGESRGIAGAWVEGDVRSAIQPTELLVGDPVSIPITPSDYAVLQYPVTPTVLLQKLGRTVKGVYNTQQLLASEFYSDIYDKAKSNPSSLAVFTAAVAKVTSTPAVSVVQPIVIPPVIQAYIDTPEEEEEDSLVEPAYSFSVGALEETVATPQPVAQVVAPSTHEAHVVSVPINEEVSLMTTTTTADAVLTVPERRPYFARSFDGLTEEEVYDFARSTQSKVLLTGEAGTGKTSSARNYAATHNLPFVTIECTQQIDQSITQGRFVPTGEGNATRWKYSQLATVIQGEGVVLINELTRMSPKAASLFLRLLEEGELLIEPLNEVIKVHPGCLFVADQNTGIGYTGTSKQDQALLDRFNIKLEFKYDSKIESNFIKSPTLLQFAENIRTASEMNDEFSVPMSTRILQNFQTQAVNLNFAFAVNSLLSNYPKTDGERDAIKMRFDAEIDSICAELGVDKGKYSTR